MENCVYIISGPPGVGKSTVSKELAYSFDKSAVIEGDLIYLMIKGGLVTPWEDEGYYMDLFWDNIISLTNNFITRGISVNLPSQSWYFVTDYRISNTNLIDVLMIRAVSLASN